MADGGGRPRTYPLTVTAVSVPAAGRARPARLDLRILRFGAPGPGAADRWAAPGGDLTWADGTGQGAASAAAACRGQAGYSLPAGHPGGVRDHPRRPGRAAGHDQHRPQGVEAGGDFATGLSPSDFDTRPGTEVRLVAGPPPGNRRRSPYAPTPRCSATPVCPWATPPRSAWAAVARVTVRIVGRAEALPGLGRGQGHLVADQRALASAATLAGADQADPAFWWLGSTDSARTTAAADALPALGHASTAPRTAAALQDDPFRSGLRRVLELVRSLAPGFAVVAFTVHAVISARQRRREFALLRAVGVRSRSLSALLGAEQVGLALFAWCRAR